MLSLTLVTALWSVACISIQVSCVINILGNVIDIGSEQFETNEELLAYCERAIPPNSVSAVGISALRHTSFSELTAKEFTNLPIEFLEMTMTRVQAGDVCQLPWFNSEEVAGLDNGDHFALHVRRTTLINRMRMNGWMASIVYSSGDTASDGSPDGSPLPKSPSIPEITKSPIIPGRIGVIPRSPSISNLGKFNSCGDLQFNDFSDDDSDPQVSDGDDYSSSERNGSPTSNSSSGSENEIKVARGMSMLGLSIQKSSSLNIDNDAAGSNVFGPSSLPINIPTAKVASNGMGGSSLSRSQSRSSLRNGANGSIENLSSSFKPHSPYLGKRRPSLLD